MRSPRNGAPSLQLFALAEHREGSLQGTAAVSADRSMESASSLCALRIRCMLREGIDMAWSEGTAVLAVLGIITYLIPFYMSLCEEVRPCR
jgi:hypothetical protein